MLKLKEMYTGQRFSFVEEPVDGTQYPWLLVESDSAKLLPHLEGQVWCICLIFGTLATYSSETPVYAESYLGR